MAVSNNDKAEKSALEISNWTSCKKFIKGWPLSLAINISSSIISFLKWPIPYLNTLVTLYLN